MHRENLHIETGIPGDAQESSFMNATLQSTGEGLDFSVAVHVEVPAGATGTDEAALSEFLWHLFMQCPDELHVEIQIGPDSDRERELEDADAVQGEVTPSE